MGTVNKKYLKDENNQIFSPIVSEDSVYTNAGMSIKKCIPLTYSFNQESFASKIQVWSGNVTNWTVIKVTMFIQMGNAADAKAVYMKLNNTSGILHSIADGRFRDATTSYYHRPANSSDSIYLGDIYHDETSYGEIVIVNSGREWHPIKTQFGTATGSSGSYTVSVLGGQFSFVGLTTSFTSLELNSTATIIGKGIIQIYR